MHIVARRSMVWGNQSELIHALQDSLKKGHPILDSLLIVLSTLSTIRYQIYFQVSENWEVDGSPARAW
jgi:hypothetical protein